MPTFSLACLNFSWFTEQELNKMVSLQPCSSDHFSESSAEGKTASEISLIIATSVSVRSINDGGLVTLFDG